MPWWYPLARDAVLGLVMVGVIWLLFKERSFLREQIRTLTERLQSIQTEATALKAFTDRFLAMFEQLSPKRLLEWVKATEEILERSKHAEIAEIKRTLETNLHAAVSERDTERTRAEKYLAAATKGINISAQAVVFLGLALYHHPKGVRQVLLNSMKDELVKTQAENIIAQYQERFGPSPADTPSAVAAALMAIAPKEEKGETRTSP